MERIWNKIAKAGMIAGMVAGGIGGVGGAYTLNELNGKLQDQDKKLQDHKKETDQKILNLGVEDRARDDINLAGDCINETILREQLGFPPVDFNECVEERQRWYPRFRNGSQPTPEPTIDPSTQKRSKR